MTDTNPLARTRHERIVLAASIVGTGDYSANIYAPELVSFQISHATYSEVNDKLQELRAALVEAGFVRVTTGWPVRSAGEWYLGDIQVDLSQK